MSGTWIRRLSVLAVAATSCAAVVGVDTLGSHLADHRPPADEQAAAAVAPIQLSTFGTAKSRPTENHRLEQQRKHAQVHRSAMRATARRAAADRADRERRTDTPDGARSLGRVMAGSHGWGAGQFSCLDTLWTNESGWETQAHNGSGAYGIPQALPGPRMAQTGNDWRTNPVTQIRWGLDYIGQRYGTPCGALDYWRSHRWY
jgi:hypothetical protein